MSSSSESSVYVPPRLLAGVTLLYWGAMTGEAFIGLIFAVLLEAKSWVKLRWDFDDGDYVKAFQVSLGLLGLVLMFVWLDEVNEDSLFQVMKWFPLCFLPVELAQRYGHKEQVNLNTFFYFSRLRMKQDLKEGRSVDPNQFNTGYPYLFIVMVVATCKGQMNVYVHVAMLVLMTAVIISVSVKRGLGWKRLVWAMPMMLVLAVWMQTEVASVYQSYKSRGRAFKDPAEGESNPYHSNLGQLGDMKKNPEIQWRMWGDDVPEYLSLNIYNTCYGAGWTYDYKQTGESHEDMDAAFDSGAGLEVGGDGAGLFVFDAADEVMLDSADVPRRLFKLRGKGQSDTEQSIVPSVGGMFAISEMAGGGVTPAVHPLGVLRLTNRKAIIDYLVWDGEADIQSSEPDENVDLVVYEKIREAVAELSIEMGLSGVDSPSEKVEVIRDFFMREFTYALHFEGHDASYSGTALERFMLKDRRGHCEYFATTAALLLREQGIATRYCIGYVAREKDGDTWVIRGSHAHAWCRSWIGGKWEIVDLTPPDWLALEGEKNNAEWSQGVEDWFQSINQDFSIWRANEENRALMNVIMWGLGVILLIWFGYRLYNKRAKEEKLERAHAGAFGYELSREFELIEAQLSSLIGERSQAQTYSGWVKGAKHQLGEHLSLKLMDLVSLHEESRFGGRDRSTEMEDVGGVVESLLDR